MADESVRPYTPEELAALEATAEKATPGKRTAVYLGDEATGVPITQPEMLDYVRRTIDISGGNAFHLVHVEAPNGGDPLDLCHTGNGRDSGANSQHIATFDRETCLRLIHQLRQQTARADRLERERDEARRVAGWRGGTCYDRADYKARAEAAERERDEARTEADHLAVGPPWEVMAHREQLVKERDAARTALAAVEVERARLFGSLAWLVEHVTYWEDSEGEPVEENDPGAIAGCVSCIDSSECAYQQAKKVLIASPHADLAAVRAAVTALQSYADGHVDCTSCARQALAQLPNWCREQP